jgi:dTDP-4-amino-4,6-dideoxygalactose transaminase
MIDLNAQNQPIAAEAKAAMSALIDSSQFVLGKAVEDLETALAEANGVAHAVGVSSGTDALILALMAHGIGPGDEVIAPSFTFFATAGAVHRVGARCVFADILPGSFNVDPAAVEAAITPKTKAIIPVHLYGQCADMNALNAIAEKHGLIVIEDAAQAAGAKDHGRPAGSMSHVGCLSFYPTKNLSAFGDAGACLTNDADLATKMKQIRLHGQTSVYHHDLVGGNFRIDSLQAAVLSVKLPHLDSYIAGRRAAAERYSNVLKSLPIVLPTEEEGQFHTYNQYTIRAENRDGLTEYLQSTGIGCKAFYPLGLHMQPCFAEWGGAAGQLPETEKAADEVLSLPMFAEITAEQQEQVAAAIKSFYAAG